MKKSAPPEEATASDSKADKDILLKNPAVDGKMVELGIGKHGL
ncbi:MAG: hypothetical protein QGG53_40255 [Planctomycetota bacterium]|jgi:hypothetical protein|nr:hypothetical protein [Planctomycetota bacterium]